MLPIFPDDAFVRAWLAEQTGRTEEPIYRVAVSSKMLDGDIPADIHRFREEDPWRIPRLNRLQDQGYRLFYESVTLYGARPFAFADYLNFLESHGVFVSLADREAYGTDTTFVIGTHDWDELVLTQYIDRACDIAKRHGTSLRIYSQEMYLFRLMSGIDPFDAPRDVLEQFGQGHCALEFLKELGFEWPTGKLVQPRQSPILPPIDGPGLLGYMGYRVGESGIQDKRERHRMLHRIFGMTVSEDMPINNPNQWGEPRSSARLKKMAYSIDAFIGLRKRQNSPAVLPIQHWESDLEWLKQRYYDTGHFSFRWPNTK